MVASARSSGVPVETIRTKKSNSFEASAAVLRPSTASDRACGAS